MCWNNAHCQDHGTDICIYIPFCIVFIILGTIQIISGIFFFITIPLIKLIVNICIGCWVILTGICGGMVACICTSNPKKHEFILYCSISVLALNIINLIFLEFGQIKEIFSENVQKLLGKEYDLLETHNGRLITTITAITSVIIAFIESQITFCMLNKSQSIAKEERIKSETRRRLYLDNDQAADLEYVIPKKTTVSRKPSIAEDTTVQVYAKSWVFEGNADEENHPGGRMSLPISSASSLSSPSLSLNQNNQLQNSQRRISKLSDANSERFTTTQMMSFSRCATPSPVPHSGQVTPTAIQMYGADYLEPNIIHKQQHRLTVDYVPPKLKHQGSASVSSQQDETQYASLLAELEQSLIEKKLQAGLSPDNSSSLATTTSTDKYCSSKSSSKDLEFSKELEAALQLIQELETPSEGPPPESQNLLSSSQLNRSESDKTLSAAVSLTSPEAIVHTSSVHTTIQSKPTSANTTPTAAAPPPAAAAAASTTTTQLIISPQQHKSIPFDLQQNQSHQQNHHHHNQQQNNHHSQNYHSNNHHQNHQQQMHNGKKLKMIKNTREINSQSTSGYSSPNSYSSQLCSINSQIMVGSVHHQQPPPTATTTITSSSNSCLEPLDTKNIVRIYLQSATIHNNNLNNNSNNNNKYGNHYHHNHQYCTAKHNDIDDDDNDDDDDENNGNKHSSLSSSIQRSPIPTIFKPSSMSKANLLFKKRSKFIPQPDIQNRILKSECLAYLTDDELIERHLKSRNEVRRIEENVAQKVKGCCRLNETSI